MSTASADFEQLLRQALDQAPAKAPEAERDLMRLASEAARAVSKVSGGIAVLELAPIEDLRDLRQVYQLQLRKETSLAPPSDLGVFRISEAGYPIDRWNSILGWEEHAERPDERFVTIDALRGNFAWLLSKPESRLVLLINYLRHNMPR